MSDFDKIHGAWDELFDFLFTHPSPEDVIAFSASETIQARIQELLRKNKEINLTEMEAHELDEYMRINHMMTLFKARAHEKMMALTS